MWATTLLLPDVPVLMRFRGFLFGFGMMGCGKNFQVAGNVMLRGLENISVGRDVYLAPGAVILAGKGVVLEDGVQVAFYSVLTDGNHTAKDGSYRFGLRSQSPILIGAGTWIGAHVTVVAGVKIGRCAVIGANSVVTREIPDGALAVGVPASVLSERRGDKRSERGVEIPKAG